MNRWSMLFVLFLAPGTFGGCTTSPGVETRVSLPKTVTTQSAGVIFRIVENGIHGSSMLVDARTKNDMSGAREDVVAWLDEL